MNQVGKPGQKGKVRAHTPMASTSPFWARLAPIIGELSDDSYEELKNPELKDRLHPSLQFLFTFTSINATWPDSFKRRGAERFTCSRGLKGTEGEKKKKKKRKRKLPGRKQCCLPLSLLLSLFSPPLLYFISFIAILTLSKLWFEIHSSRLTRGCVCKNLKKQI